MSYFASLVAFLLLAAASPGVADELSPWPLARFGAGLGAPPQWAGPQLKNASAGMPAKDDGDRGQGNRAYGPTQANAGFGQGHNAGDIAGPSNGTAHGNAGNGAAGNENPGIGNNPGGSPGNDSPGNNPGNGNPGDGNPGNGNPGNGNGGSGNPGHHDKPTVEDAAGEIAAKLAGDSDGLTCRRIQRATQELMLEQGDAFKNHGQAVRSVVKQLRQDLKDQLTRKDVTPYCFGCIVNQFAQGIAIDQQEPCGGHDICQTGDRLDRDFSECTAQICETDPSCCNAKWDETCVEEVTAVCGQVCSDCSHDVCETGAALRPSCHSCAATVCEQDPFCCDTQWDNDCVDRARSECNASCGPVTTTLPPPTTTVPVTTTTLSTATTTTVPGETTTTVPAPTTTVPGQTTTTVPVPTTTLPSPTTTLGGGGTTTLPAPTTTIAVVTTTTVGVTTTTVTSIAECPTSAVLAVYAGTGSPCSNDADCPVGTCDPTLQRCVTPTQLDTGWTGISHDADVTNGLTVKANLDCAGSGPACGECSIAGIDPEPRNCRCANDNRVVCQQPFQADNTSCGGNTCSCYLGPPLALSAGNTPACVVNRLAQDLTGTTNVDTGDSTSTLALRSLVYLGESLVEPCPYCTGDTTPGDGNRNGTCVLGPNDGLPCDSDAFNESFPAPGGDGSSLDCFPSSGKNVSGSGLIINITQSTGALSLTAGIPCSIGDASLCHCGLCESNVSVPCSSNADCTGGGTGICKKQSLLVPLPNQCDTTCTDTGDGVNGLCDGPTDHSCDAIVRANGEGFIQCQSNADCDPQNIGVDAGSCTLTKQRPCFLPTIVASGSADPQTPISAGIFCVPPTANGGINSVAGLPGPGRLVNQGLVAYLCTGGTYVPGVGCP